MLSSHPKMIMTDLTKKKTKFKILIQSETCSKVLTWTRINRQNYKLVWKKLVGRKAHKSRHSLWRQFESNWQAPNLQMMKRKKKKARLSKRYVKSIKVSSKRIPRNIEKPRYRNRLRIRDLTRAKLRLLAIKHIGISNPKRLTPCAWNTMSLKMPLYLP